jgi:hypothetical protein
MSDFEVTYMNTDELDKDVIRALRSKPNRSEYIRNLVRRDIRR